MKKKSLVGWINKNWAMYKLDSIQADTEYIFHSIISKNKSGLRNQKVRITISEIK